MLRPSFPYPGSSEFARTGWLADLLVLYMVLDLEYVLETNERLANVTAQYEAATVVHSTFENDGFGTRVSQWR